MDKLEKALEKAREQRKITLEQQGRQQSGPPPAKLSNAAYTPTATSVQIEDNFLEAHHIIAHHTRNQDADTFRILRTKILQIMSQGGMKTLGITSANYGDGKTTIGLNLAVSIALDLKQTVLLVDLDLRKPSVPEYLGLQPQYGISDYFLHNVPIAKCFLRPSFDRFTILPAGQVMDNSSEVLGSPQMAALADELKTRYDDRIIIYDLPPTLVQDDPIAFLPHVDAVLLVVNDGVTKINELKHALNVLSGTNVIGTVLNHPGEKKKSKLYTKFTTMLNTFIHSSDQSADAN